MPTGVYKRTQKTINRLKKNGFKKGRTQPREVIEANRKRMIGNKLCFGRPKPLNAYSFPKGAKHPFWKGGLSRSSKTGYGTLKYRLWRESIFERDNFTCRGCGFKGNQGYLTAHHINSWAKYPELRFNIDNGITLCEDCHKLTDNYKGRACKK